MARPALTRTAHASFLAALDRAAEEAAVAMGGFEDRFYRMAGLAVRLRFAGPALVPCLTRAIAHLSVPATSDPPLTIRIWKGESPQAPPSWRGRMVRGSFGEGDRGFFQWGEGSLTVLDADRGEGFYRVRSVNDEPGPDRAAPLSSILRSWLAEREVQLVHAAGVGSTEGCVLLVGGRAAGKSTAVLACVAAGLGCIGDDTCLIGPGESPTVFSLYGSVQADAAALERLPFLELADLPRGRRGKALAFLQEHALLPQAPLAGIAIVRATDRRDTRIRPASAGEALAAVGPTSILRMPGSAPSTLARLARVLEGAPSYRLDVGTEPGRVAGGVEALL